MDTYTHRCNSKNTREKVGICYLCKWVHSRALVGIVSMYITDCCERDIFIIFLPAIDMISMEMKDLTLKSSNCIHEQRPRTYINRYVPTKSVYLQTALIGLNYIDFLLTNVGIHMYLVKQALGNAVIGSVQVCVYVHVCIHIYTDILNETNLSDRLLSKSVGELLICNFKIYVVQAYYLWLHGVGIMIFTAF